MSIVKSRSYLATLLLLLAPEAFAQHGSVNGPVTAGPLNPASGATTFQKEAIDAAVAKCVKVVITDMLDPFYNTWTSKETSTQHRVDNIEISFKISGNKLLLLSYDLDGESISLKTIGRRKDTIFSNFYFSGVPVITSDSASEPIYDPQTHAIISYTFYQHHVAFRWSGRSNVSPKDPSNIVLENPDHTKTNFIFNGTKYLQCVESEL